MKAIQRLLWVIVLLLFFIWLSIIEAKRVKADYHQQPSDIQGYVYPDPYPNIGVTDMKWAADKIIVNWLKPKGNGEVVNLITFAKLLKQYR